MDMLQAAVAAHMHGAPMAHSAAAQLRPFLSEIDLVDTGTLLFAYDVVKLPVTKHKNVWIWGVASKLPLIDYSRVPKDFPRPSGGLASGCVWTFNSDHIVELSHRAGNSVYYCAESWDVWAVLGPPAPCGDKRAVTATGNGSPAPDISDPDATESDGGCSEK